MIRHFILSCAALCTIQATIAVATDLQFSAHAKSGEPTRVRTFFDCIRHSPGGGGGAFAEHGTVNVKFVTQKRCGNANEPTNEVWYTSPAGFKGTDTVTIPISGATRVSIDVTVE
jgi:hypothetical protein